MRTRAWKSGVVLGQGLTGEAGFDDGLAAWIEVFVEEALDLIVEELGQDRGTLVVGGFADFWLQRDIEEPATDGLTFNLDRAQVLTQQRATRILQRLGREFGQTATAEEFTRQPLASESNFPAADMLVGNQHEHGVLGVDDLLQQDVGLIDLAAGSERPVGTNTFRLHALLVDDRWVAVAARGNQAPQPGQAGVEQVEQTHDAVGRMLGIGRWATHAERADVDRDLVVDHIVHVGAGQHHAWVWAGLAGFVLRHAPTAGWCHRGGFDVEEQHRAGRMNRQLLQHWVGTVVGDVVDANKPRRLGVHQRQLTLAAVGILQRAMAQRHVVGDWLEGTALRHLHKALFAGEQVGAEQQLAVVPDGACARAFRSYRRQRHLRA